MIGPAAVAAGWQYRCDVIPAVPEVVRFIRNLDPPDMQRNG